MKKLIIMRHAKASNGEANMADIDRPLNLRGTKAAPRMAEELIKRNIVPQKIFSSKAVRAKETAKLVAKTLKMSLRDIKYENRFYFGFREDYFDHIRLLDDELDFAMLIGHNPTIEAITCQLAKNKELCGEMPTAAIAYFEFDVESWKDIKANLGDLKYIIRPRELS